MNLQEFIAKYTGQIVGPTDADRGQCVGLVMTWVENLGNPIFYGNAVDLFPNADPNLYDKHTSGVPVPGDIVIWGAAPNDPYLQTGPNGHTGIYVSGDSNNFLNTFDQNFPTGSSCHIVHHHDFNAVIGWLHPKKLDQQGGDNSVQPQDRVVEAFNNLLGRDPEQAELDVWKAAGEPEPRGWAWNYIQTVNSPGSPRHGNLWQQLEQHLNVHDANDIQRLQDEAKAQQAATDQQQITTLQTQLNDCESGHPSSSTGGGGFMNQSVSDFFRGKKTYLISALVFLDVFVKWLGHGDYSLPSIFNLLNDPSLDVAGVAATLRSAVANLTPKTGG